jgi:alkanesulfonate monooxygenase SsuD/methylene tetrahydromethanopterin reductase-like flavin-dependent oxidoreductase (luciferase family)
VVSTTYSEPFHVSSQLASLDHLTAGRTGWVAAATDSAAAARAWGRPAVTGPAALRREAAGAVEVVRALWDSWEDDAVIRDVASSRYLDRDRLHYIDFAGPGYSVKGPAIVPRPPQGQLPVLAAAGLVPDHLADVSLISAPDLAGLAAAAAASGTPRTFAEVEVALDTEDQAAAQRVAGLSAHGPWADQGRLRYAGPPAGLVALLAELAGIVAGARLHPLVLDEDLAVLARLVVPPLIAGGQVSRPLPGATFRDTLGLPRPASRYRSAPSAERAAR